MTDGVIPGAVPEFHKVSEIDGVWITEPSRIPGKDAYEINVFGYITGSPFSWHLSASGEWAELPLARGAQVASRGELQALFGQRRQFEQPTIIIPGRQAILIRAALVEGLKSTIGTRDQGWKSW